MRTHATTTEELRELVALSSFTGHAEARVLLANCAADLLAARAEVAALRRELSDLLARMFCAVNALTASGSDKLEARWTRVAPVREVLARYGINAPSTEEEIIRECPPTMEEER